jgi:hypothetical protein
MAIVGRQEMAMGTAVFKLESSFQWGFLDPRAPEDKWRKKIARDNMSIVTIMACRGRRVRE